MDLGAVSSGIESRLKSISGLRVYGWTGAKPNPPCALVGAPERVVVRGGSRGVDRIEGWPIIMVAGRPNDRNTLSTLSPYVSIPGPQSITAVLESGTYVAFDSIEIKTIEIQVAELAGVEYLTGLFSATITGPGGTP